MRPSISKDLTLGPFDLAEDCVQTTKNKHTFFKMGKVAPTAKIGLIDKYSLYIASYSHVSLVVSRQKLLDGYGY